MTTSTSTTSSIRTAPSAAARRRVRLLAAATAVLVPVLIWLVAVPLLGTDLVVPGRTAGTSMELDLGAVLFISVLSVAAGWTLLAVLERLWSRARTGWLIIAVAVLLLSFAPLLSGELSGSTRLTLGLMHLAVGLALIPPLVRTSPRR
ncbi:MAG TPA: DUF6069 family protein [Actinoplanes sp.]|jgi:hypothetical protein